MALNDLIAEGGTRVKSPVQRYLETKQQVNTEERNKLSELATRQAIGIQQQQNTRANQQLQAKNTEAYAKAVTPIIEKINLQPDKQAAYEAALPEMDRIARGFGVDTSNMSDVFDQPKADGLIARFGTQDKAVFKQMADQKGDLQQGRIVNGRVFDRDGNPQPTWSVAPTKQETGSPGSFLSKGGKNKKELETLDAEEGVYKITNNLNTLKQFINSPDYVGGTTGDAIGAGNSLVQQMRQLTGLGEFKEGNLPKGDVENVKGEEFSSLRKAANLGDRKAGLTIELAYNIAKSFDKGGRVTDADFRFARQVIDGSADRASTIAQIDDFMKRKQQDYTASNRIISEKLGREPSPYSDERYRELYNIKAPAAAPTNNLDKLRQELKSQFGGANATN